MVLRDRITVLLEKEGWGVAESGVKRGSWGSGDITVLHLGGGYMSEFTLG